MTGHPGAYDETWRASACGKKVPLTVIAHGVSTGIELWPGHRLSMLRCGYDATGHHRRARGPR